MTRRYILNAEQEALYRRAPRVVSPSKIGEQPWEGHWRDGAIFSERQLRELAHMHLDPETIDRLDVIAAGDPRRVYLTEKTAISFRQIVYFYRRLTCPIIGSRGDRLRVISPSGAPKLVYPDGSLTRPKVRRAA